MRHLRACASAPGNNRSRDGHVMSDLAIMCYTLSRTPTQGVWVKERPMRADKSDVVKRLNYIEGHLGGIRKMVENDEYCVDILRQTYAVRKAIEKLETLILENHLHGCVQEGIKNGREQETIDELPQRYNVPGNR